MNLLYDCLKIVVKMIDLNIENELNYTIHIWNIILSVFGLKINEPEDFIYKNKCFKNWRGGCYANGEPKSVLRGIPNFIALFTIIPFHIYQMSSVCNNRIQIILTCNFLLVSSAFYIISYKFHMKTLNIHIEDIYRRIEYNSIFILSIGVFIPHGILLMQSEYNTQGLFLILLIFLILYSGMFHSWNKKSSDQIDFITSILYIFNVNILLPFFYFLYYSMTNFEFYSMVVSTSLSIISIIIYSFNLFDFVPDIWGYRETFHLFVILSNGLRGIYLTSIISRLN